jgi:uncharacterized Ntn-hydrolase superfamily protein
MKPRSFDPRDACACFTLICSLAFTVPAHATFSIVARDSVTGEVGMAILSRGFRAGAASQFVDWRKGAVIAQAFPNMQHMPDGLRMLAEGLSADSVVARLVAPDTLRMWRQLGVVDTRGGAAAYTGAKTYFASGQLAGRGYAVQGNSLANERVVPAMAHAYERSQGDLADRMFAAIEAGLREGGDGAGHAAAALCVSRPGYRTNPLVDPTGLDPLWLDVRVDYSPEPLESLRFMLRAARTRALSDSARTLIAEQRPAEAISLQRKALAMDPADDELAYDLAERLAQAGQPEAALTQLAKVLARNPAMRGYAARQPAFKALREDPRFQRAVKH